MYSERVKLKSRNKKYILFILVLPLFIMVALRSNNVGNDTMMYKALYENLSQRDFFEAITVTNMEWGFTFLCYLGGKLGLNYVGFKMLIAAITYFVLYKYLIKHSETYSASILLFMCFLGFFRSMNIMREMLAVCLSLSSIDLLMEKKYKKFIFFVLGCFLIHRTAIVLLLLPIMNADKIKGLRKTITMFGAIICLFLADYIISIFVGVFTKYSYLIGSKYTTENGWMAMLLLMMFSMLFVILLSRRKTRIKGLLNQSEGMTNNAAYQAIQRIDLLNSCFYLCIIFAALGTQFGLADRAALYFSTYFIEAITLNKQFDDKNNRLLKYIIIILAILYYLLVMIYRNSWQGTIPYSTIYYKL